MAEKNMSVAAELIVKTRKWKEGMQDAKKSTQDFMKDLKKGTKKSKKDFDDLAKGAEKTFKSMKTGAMLAGAAIVGMFTAGAMAGGRFIAEMEKSLASYETLLRSTEKAKKMIGDILALSKASPFEFQGLDKSAKLLLAMGFEAEKIVPTMHSIGNAVAAAGGNTETLQGVSLALGQIQTKGKLSAEEMNQLAERGIPAWEILSQKLGMSTQELMKMGEQGKLFAEDVLPSLLAGLDERFAGSMEKQNKTFLGMWSNLKESGKIILGEATVEFFNAMQGDLSSLVKKLDEFKKNGSLTKWAKDAGNSLKKMYDIAKQAGAVLVSIAVGIKNNWGVIEPILVGVVSAMVGLKIVGVITLLWKGYQAAVAFATVAQHGLNAAIMANPIAAIIALIVALGVALYYLVKNWDKVKLGFQIGVLQIQKAFMKLRIAAGEMILKLMDTLEPLVKWIGKVAPGIVEGFESARAGVKQKTEAMAGDVENLEKRINISLKKMKYGLENFEPGLPTQGLHDLEKMTALELQNYQSRSSKKKISDETIDTDITDKGGSSGISPFERAMSEYQYLVDMGKLSTNEQLKYLQKIKKNYAKTVDDIRSINVELKNKQEELNKESFESSKKWIDQKKYYNELSLKQELAAWKRIQKRYLQGTDERIEADREVYRVTRELEREKFNASKKWIEERKYYNQLSLKEELAAWERVLSRYKEGTEEYLEASREIYRVRQEIADSIEQIADKVIETYKAAYQKQKELALNAIDQELDALEKAHRNKIRLLDDELSKYEEIINAKLKSIDREDDQESYDKKLSKEQQKRQELLSQINLLSLDNSMEARSKLADLNKELSEQEERIEEMKSNRSTDLRKQELKNSLDNFKKTTDSKKKAETNQYNATKSRLDREVSVKLSPHSSHFPTMR